MTVEKSELNESENRQQKTSKYMKLNESIRFGVRRKTNKKINLPNDISDAVVINVCVCVSVCVSCEPFS